MVEAPVSNAKYFKSFFLCGGCFRKVSDRNEIRVESWSRRTCPCCGVVVGIEGEIFRWMTQMPIDCQLVDQQDCHTKFCVSIPPEFSMEL